MKYLKRFNEELNSSTYMSASRKLKKIGNKSSLDRAEDLANWAEVSKGKEQHSAWLKAVDIYSKFGSPVKAKLNGKNLGFYLDVSFDSGCFSDTFEDASNENPDHIASTIPLGVYLVPATQKDYDECVSDLGYDYLSNGSYQSYYISIDFDIVDDVVNLAGFNLYQEEEVMITLSPIGASRLKDLIIKLFSDRDLNFPSSDNRYETEYESLNAAIMMEAGFSSTYGFELQDIADYIATIPKQKFIN